MKNLKKFSQISSKHLNGQGCVKCGYDKLSNKHRDTKDEFIKKSISFHGKKYDYSLVKYIDKKSKVVIKCNNCNNSFIQSPINHLKGKSGCKCPSSSGERIINNYLIENKIDFVREKKFKNCKYINCLPFDFYLPELNILIEFDGKQHHVFVEHFHKTEQKFKIQQEKDAIKTQYCIDNKIELIRIRFDEDAIKILNKRFKKITE